MGEILRTTCGLLIVRVKLKNRVSLRALVVRAVCTQLTSVHVNMEHNLGNRKIVPISWV